MPLATGTLLNNRYQILSILGQGGMGAVYRAQDVHLTTYAAVKENLFLTEEYGRQFQREATILAGLRHPNLPHVTDYFSLENQGQYLVMDYIEGEDLRQRMERMGALPEREAVLVGVSICDALSYLHTRQPSIVHRDIKPGNIKVTPDGQAVLVDFGLAKIMQGNQATSTGARAMTPGYSPPEQYGTARTDPRSDIYSLGATLYASLTGVIPEDGLARMTGKSELTPIRDLTPRVSRRLAECIQKALEVDPDDRFQSAQEFKQGLVEAGEMKAVFQERPTITPPPLSSARVETGSNGDGPPVSSILDFEDDEEFTFPPQRRERSSRRRKKQLARNWRFVGAAAFLMIFAAVYIIAFQRPRLQGAVAAYFSSSATATEPGTRIASVLANSATPELEETVSPPEGETPQPTASLILSPTPELTSTPTETVIPSPTPLGGPPSQIAFASDRTGVMQIFLMNTDGSQQRQITNERDGACQPNWSPDGQRLVFTSPCPIRADTYPNSNIYIINADGTGKMPLPGSPEGDYDPAWSPNGKRIAFTSLRTGKPAIFVIDLDTQVVQELSRSRFADKQPAWSPNGMQIAYVRTRTNSAIYVMTDTGQPQSQFTQSSGNVNNLWPVWSNDGNVIFFSQATDKMIPWLVGMRYEDRNTPREFRIPASSQLEPGPVAKVAPSPDGFWLAYEGWPDGTNHDIYIMTINGANQQRLTTDPGIDFGAAWRPSPTATEPAP